MTDTPITWGTDNLLVVDWARATITDNTFPAAANLRVVTDADGAKFVWDAFQATLNWTDAFFLQAVSGDAMCSAKYSVPVSLVAAHSPLPNDDRTFRSGGAASGNPALFATGVLGNTIYAELAADGLNPQRFATMVVSANGAPNLLAAQPSNMAAFRERLEGANTKIVGGLLKTSYAGSGATAPALAPGTYVSGDVLPTGQAGGTNAAKTTVLSWPAGEVRIHDIGLFMQQAPAAVPPPAMGAVMYRDRADGGKFKPLTEVRARGFVDAPQAPDLSALSIKYVDVPLPMGAPIPGMLMGAYDFATGGMGPDKAPDAAGTGTVVPGGVNLVLQATPTTTAFSMSVEAPITTIPPLHDDDRISYVKCHVEVKKASIPSGQFGIPGAGSITLVGGGASINVGTIGGSTVSGDQKSSQPVAQKELLKALSNNPRLRFSMDLTSTATIGPIDVDVTITGLALLTQEPVAGP